MMVEPNDDDGTSVARAPDETTPQASSIRIIGIHGGIAVELFDVAGEPITYCLLGGAGLAMAKRQWEEAVAMGEATDGPGLAGMACEGRA